MTTKILLTMPQPGETITEGMIVRWMVKEGNLIKEGQHIVELETEKALFEYESPYEGTLVEILEGNGATVHVGNPIAVFEVEDSKAATYFMLGIGQKPEGVEEAPVEIPQKKLSPLIRRLIQEYGIKLDDLDSIQGTGPGGRITKENIISYIESRKKTESKESDVDYLPCLPVRVRIAENMLQSKKSIPHAHTNLTIDMTKVVDYRNRVKDKFEKENSFSLGYLPLIWPALKKAIQQYPLVNASFKDDGKDKKIALYKKIHLGVAVGTDRGLYTPVLKNAESKSYLEFARDMEGLLTRAKENRFTVQDVTGVTFTFNNYGFFGTNIGVQIIPSPQSAVLGMGQIEKRPWVVDDEIKIRLLSEFTLAFDHRVMDGRDAGLFMLVLKEAIEKFSEEALWVN